MRQQLNIENPAVAAEWDYDKNNGCSPSEFSGGSEYKSWWRCGRCNHSWQAKIYSRTEGRGCPVCGRERVKPGINDLVTLAPKIAGEWDYDKNGDVVPGNVTSGSNVKFWWKCNRCGHSWKTTPNHRYGRNQDCLVCAGQEVKIGFNDLATTHPHLAAEWNDEKNGNNCPEHYTKGADIRVWWDCAICGYEWDAVLYSRTSKNPTGCPSCAGNILVVGKNDLQTVNPTLAEQWDCEKNYPLTASDVAVNSNEKAWWKDKLGHSWETVISSRNSGKGCPFCANRKLLRGFNDLTTHSPSLAKQWDKKKNYPLTANDVVYGSHDYAWWKCAKRHSWRTKITSRTNGTGCPYCHHTELVPGETDLESVRPDIAAGWDYEKNYPLTPKQTTAWTRQKVWWNCKKCGLSYKTAINNRKSADSCPYCHGKLPIVGKTDFATVHPELLSEYDYENNGSLTPQSVVAGSHKLAWWYCRKHNHHWQATFEIRHNGRKCKYCSGTAAIPGETDAAAVAPELESEWDTERNVGIDLRSLLPFSNEKFWWKCNKCNRHWQSTLGARVAGSRCPRCNGKTPMETHFII
jgi:DNA-directed RNA polymerase subunit RPC12/RpoP